MLTRGLFRCRLCDPRCARRYKLKLAEKRIRTAKAETDVKVDEVRASKDALEEELRAAIDEKNKEYVVRIDVSSLAASKHTHARFFLGE